LLSEHFTGGGRPFHRVTSSCDQLLRSLAFSPASGIRLF
jgi:hypothetical protein